MSEIDDWLNDVPTSQVDEPSLAVSPSPLPLITHSRPQRSNPFWILAICVLAFWLGMNFDGCKVSPVPTPDDDTVVIDDDGKFVVILKDGSEDGQSKLSKNQSLAIRSTDVSDWCRDNGFDFRIIDVDDKVTTMEPIWGTLKGEASPAPSLTVAIDGKVTTGDLPDGIEATIEALESLQ
jgi:hypothetical protein